MIDFHDVVFPENVSYGASGGPSFNTTIIELASGYEQRNINWSVSKARYEVSHGVKTRDEMEDLLDFFYARNGRAYGFLFKDWSDFEFEHVWTSNGATGNIACFKRYEADTAFSYQRRIRKLKPGTMKLFRNNSLVIDEATDYDTSNDQVWFDHADGAFSIRPETNPGAGIVWKVTGEFYVPVRFDTDDMTISHDAWESMSWPSIPLVELRKLTSDPSVYVRKLPLF
jgi:uncharacterized protein (TIGR02217 family)